MLEAIGGWFSDLFRTIFLYLDFLVYWLVDQIYSLFMLIADTGIFNPDTIMQFSSRIYVLLAIIMIFVVSFSMIKYIINPDEFLDQKRGVTHLLKNFFIVLIAIAAVPSVFRLAFEFQSIVLRENLIGKIVLGDMMTTETMVDPDTGEQVDQITFGGKTMGATVFSAFFKPNQEKWKGCTYPDYTLNDAESCGESITAITTLSSRLGDNKDVIGVINAGIVNEKIAMTADDGTDVEVYAIDYVYLISAICGGFLAYVLLVFCIDIAVRAVKLGFLQLIAPIPIISLLDPREKGSGMFGKWTKNVISTYMGLFIRLIAIYFAISVVIVISNTQNNFFSITGSNTQTGNYVGVAEGDPVRAAFVKVFIIFGCLLFAKELPKMLEELTGMKLDTGGMNLKNRIKSMPGVQLAPKLAKTTGKIGARAALGVGGLIGAGAAGAYGNYQATKEWNENLKPGEEHLKRSAIGSAIGGGLTGAGRGVVGGVAQGRAGIDSAVETTRAHQERRAKASKGVKIDGEDVSYGAGARNSDRLALATGGKTRAQQLADTASDFETKTDDYVDSNGVSHTSYKKAQEDLFAAQQNYSMYQGFYDDGLSMKNDQGELLSFNDSAAIEAQRQEFMNEYTASPGTSAEQEAIEKAEWAQARFAEKVGVSEADWQKYEEKIKTKEIVREKQQVAHDKENELTKMKVSADKQKKLQESFGIGVKKETKKKK